MSDELVDRERQVVSWYRAHRGEYALLVERASDLIRQALFDRGVQVHSVDARVKAEESFVQKCLRADRDGALKYDDPVTQITDVAGLRITTYLSAEVQQTRQVLTDLFGALQEEPRPAAELSTPGYASVHFVTQIPQARLVLPEYRRFEGMRFEIQLRTILQHAWAEIQHDVVYKGPYEVPQDLHRRLVALAGLLELADREFSDVITRLTDRREVEEVVHEGPAHDDASAEPVTPAVLRYELEERVGGATDLHSDWFGPLLDVLTALDITTRADLQEALGACRVPVDQLRRHLADHGYSPGPVELVDAMLRCSYGRRYLDARSSFTTAPTDVQDQARTAVDRLVALQEAGAA